MNLEQKIKCAIAFIFACVFFGSIWRVYDTYYGEHASEFADQVEQPFEKECGAARLRQNQMFDIALEKQQGVSNGTVTSAEANEATAKSNQALEDVRRLCKY
ncbi:hypothetical protein IFO70_33330 [Phormidium tenue FACHB-886]|nr:hypothetical protein [Phormidium tenue FACHB-886]